MRAEHVIRSHVQQDYIVHQVVARAVPLAQLAQYIALFPKPILVVLLLGIRAHVERGRLVALPAEEAMEVARVAAGETHRQPETNARFRDGDVWKCSLLGGETSPVVLSLELAEGSGPQLSGRRRLRCRMGAFTQACSRVHVEL
eukprot:scaffold5782_cov36-Phaeocystis_antarctica.AAC.5